MIRLSRRHAPWNFSPRVPRGVGLDFNTISYHDNGGNQRYCGLQTTIAKNYGGLHRRSGRPAHGSTDAESRVQHRTFATVPNAALGTAGVGIIGGPGLYLWDVSWRKEFRLAERRRIRFPPDRFSIMNQTSAVRR